MNDERGATWKLLLPTRQETSALVFGGDEDVMRSLERTAARIDARPAAGIVYDWIVFCENDLSEEVSSLIDRFLAPGGHVVVFSAALRRDLCRTVGLQPVAFQGGLPSGNPRLLLPLATHAHRRRALEFHTPGRNGARLAMTLAILLSQVGIRGHLSRWQVSILARPDVRKTSDTLAGWLADRSRRTVEETAIYAGSNTPGRKMTVRALCRQPKEDFVCKIADTDAGAAAIVREGDALEHLGGSPIASHIPRILFQEAWRGYLVQAQTLGRKRHRKVGRLTASHLEFLTEMARLEANEIPFSETPYWHEGVEHDSLGTLESPPTLRAAESHCRDRNLGSIAIPVHRVHGDFASWNIHETKTGLFVYDWEESHTQGNAWFECFHFLVRQASLVGPWPGANRVLKSIQRAIDTIPLPKMATSISWQDLMVPWLVWEYRRRQSRHVTELLEVLLP